MSTADDRGPVANPAADDDQSISVPISDIPGASRRDLYLRVAFFLLLLLAINVCIAWILQYYVGNSVISDLSFVGHDPSWIPKDTSFPPALGQHYFGDFEQYMGYARTSIPLYGPTIVYSPAYGPFAVVFVKVLSHLFGWPGAVFFFLIAFTALFLVGIVRLLGNSLDSRLLGLLLLLTGGMAITLDRGNLQLLVAALCVWFCVGALERRPLILIVSLAAAIAIKVYVAIFLLVLIRQRRWREALWVGAVAIVIYLFSFLIIAGGDVPHSLVTFIHTEGLFASSPKAGTPFKYDYLLGCVSAASAVYKTFLLIWGPSEFAHRLPELAGWLIQLPGLVVGCLCLVLIWLARRPLELGLIVALAMMQLVPASTYPYLQINLVIELCLLLRLLTRTRPSPASLGGPLSYGDPAVSRNLLLVCVGLLVVGSAPWVGEIYGKTGSATPLTLDAYIGTLASIAVLITLFVGLIAGRRRQRRETGQFGQVPPAVDQATDEPDPENTLSRR